MKIQSLGKVAKALLAWGLLLPSAHAFRYWQEVAVPQAGLVRARLPYETLGKARAREEIRLFDPTGEETPLVIQGLELGPSPKNTELDLLPVTFIATHGTEYGTRLDITPPLPHVVVDRMEVGDVGDIDLRAVKAGYRVTSSSGEWIPPDGQFSQAEIVYPKGGSPFILAGWSGYAHDGYQWIGFLKSKSGREVQVRQIRARVRPYHLAFNAGQPGRYVLRFGGKGQIIDPILVYGDRQSQLQDQVRAAVQFHPAHAGPIQELESPGETSSPPPPVIPIEPSGLFEVAPPSPILGEAPSPTRDREGASGFMDSHSSTETMTPIPAGPTSRSSTLVVVALWVTCAFLVGMIVFLFVNPGPKRVP